MVMEPEETPSERPQLRTVREEGGGVEGPQNQSPPVMEIPDSTSECEEGAGSSPVKTEDRSFVAGLHCFMKGRGTPIERIPHLGFKQINLWRIYKAVENLGGYDSVTARRLWKTVYDELGGSPGSTSAATCTRRHYERLLLPFERQLRGEEDRPLPASKPRKHYKRGVESKDCKSEGKRKRGQLDTETDFVESPEADQCETVARVHSSPWSLPSDEPHPDCPQPHEGGDDRSHGAYTRPHLIPDATPAPWSCPVPSRVGEVISPLEKKKRVAQASLGQSRSPGQGDREDRPSVIHRSQSPGPPTPAAITSPEGSPLPRSSSSSRSPSPYSVSSEDCAAHSDHGPSDAGREPLNYSTGRLSPVSGSSAAPKLQSRSSNGGDLAGHPGLLRAVPLVTPLPADAVAIKSQSKHSVWSPVGSGTNRFTAHYLPPPTSCTYTVKSVWVPSTSTTGFTKVHPKLVEPLRPVPFQPGYRPLQNPNRAMHHDDAPSYAKKLHMAPRPYHSEKKERSRSALPKPLPTQQPLFHSGAGIPVSYLVPAAYDRAGRDARHPPGLHPLLVPANLRLGPQAQSGPVYRHVMMGPGHAAPYEPALYSYPYSIPLWNPQTGYSLTGVSNPYPHTRL